MTEACDGLRSNCCSCEGERRTLEGDVSTTRCAADVCSAAGAEIRAGEPDQLVSKNCWGVRLAGGCGRLVVEGAGRRVPAGGVITRSFLPSASVNT